MKLKRPYLIICLLSIIITVLFTTIFNSCEKERAKVMKVKLDTVYDISETTAKAIGTVLDLGIGIEEHGHCWATSRGPVLEDDNYTEYGAVTRVGAYTSDISGLEAETKYYLRAYIKNGSETKYSEEELSFNTSEVVITETLPVVAIGTVQSVSSTEATISGTIENLGTGVTSVSEHGHCWSTTTTTPTVSDLKTTHGVKTSTGSFNSTLVSLTPGAKYYVRVYATNSVGTAYSSNNIDFTTNEDIAKPTVTTTEVTEVTNNTAVSGGNVIFDGGAAVTAKGVCWNTSPNPTLINLFTTNGTGTGDYTSYITGLAINTTYYVRAYATNSVGTAYGEQKIFTTGMNINWEPGDDWVDIRDGQEYGTVQIGAQVWMTENLNIGIRIDGMYIPWEDTVIEKYCYNDLESKCDEYGGLYLWEEMMDYTYSESTQGICPAGWHLPSDEEWIDLEEYLGMDEGEFYLYDWRGTDEAIKLKEGGSTGFDALMAGWLNPFDELFYSENTYGYFWTTTFIDDFNAIYRGLQFSYGTILRYYYDTYGAFSVRCIKD